MAIVSDTVGYLIVGILAVSFLLLGELVRRRLVTSHEDFLVAGRKVRWSILSGSLIVTWVWASTVLASGEATYTFGFPAFWIYPLSGISMAVLLPLFIRARKALPKGITFLDLIRIRFGKVVHIISLLITLYIFGLLMFYLFIGLGWGLEPILGIPWWQLMVIGGVSVIAYSTLAGLWADLITDYAMYAIVWILTVVAVLYAVGGVGGFGALYNGLTGPTASKGISVITPAAYVGYFLPILGWFFYAMMDQTIWQRVYALDEDKDTTKMLTLSWVGWSLYPMVAAIIGLVALQQGMALTVGTEAFPAVILRFAPGWVAIGFVAVIFGAIASTLNSFLLAISSLVVKDLYLPYVAKGPVDDKRVLKLSRLVVIAAGVVGMIISLNPASLLVIGIYLTGFLFALTAPLTLGLFIPRANPRVVSVALVVAFVIAAVLWTGTYFGYIKEIGGIVVTDWGIYLTLLLGTLAIVGIGSLIAPGKSVTFDDVARVHAAEVQRG